MGQEFSPEDAEEILKELGMKDVARAFQLHNGDYLKKEHVQTFLFRVIFQQLEVREAASSNKKVHLFLYTC